MPRKPQHASAGAVRTNRNVDAILMQRPGQRGRRDGGMNDGDNSRAGLLRQIQCVIATIDLETQRTNARQEFVPPGQQPTGDGLITALHQRMLLRHSESASQ